MICADTSVWVDHFRAGDERLMALLAEERIGMHPFVIAELMLGSLRNRHAVREMLEDLPELIVAGDTEIIPFIERSRLFGRGIGFVDAHLLAGVCLTPGAKLWTRDKRLARAASDLNVAAPFD
ncbi:type II toxin-antitoxin system VapC family toxin [Salinarimonas ramus]|uniref:Ribonuclease VapC n=1 Tax=Salinarimonas ramus TaxID=690164 RepID=A0A917Q5S5_9HYPH|nr:type II toxin-antitoxin system VapC family toxin [Salinarimonas ramus]GGK30229.1 ribonuclease VapC32 [Salinarimonas ramus]